MSTESAPTSRPGTITNIAYGKANVSFYRTYAKPLIGLTPIPESPFTGRPNILFAYDAEVEVLDQTLAPAYTEGDNSLVVATDTMKNFIHEVAIEFEGATLRSTCSSWPGASSKPGTTSTPCASRARRSPIPPPSSPPHPLPLVVALLVMAPLAVPQVVVPRAPVSARAAPCFRTGAATTAPPRWMSSATAPMPGSQATAAGARIST